MGVDDKGGKDAEREIRIMIKEGKNVDKGGKNVDKGR